jgi:class 3 adenylate cyclase
MRGEPCPACGFSNAPASRFCGGCGTRLDAGSARAVRGDSGLGAPAAGGFEQRRVTVLFSEVVGLPLLAASLDPEELNDVVQRYYQIFARANARFDGCVASLSTDGTLAIFGYPNAHEDDAERALLAAQALLNERLLLNPGKRLHMRVGVATGVVGIGAPVAGAKSPEISVVGEAPNLAARLQSVAEPGAILIASGTRRLLGDLFELEPTEPMALKGFDEPVIAWRVGRHTGSR